MSKKQKVDREALLRGIGARTGKSQPSVPQSAIDRAPKDRPATPKSRDGLVGLTSWHRPEVIKQLKMLAVREDAKQQYLVAEALNLLFQKYRLPSIADEK